MFSAKTPDRNAFAGGQAELQGSLRFTDSCFHGLSPVPRLTAASGIAPGLGRGAVLPLGAELCSLPLRLAGSRIFCTEAEGLGLGTGRILGPGGVWQLPAHPWGPVRPGMPHPRAESPGHAHPAQRVWGCSRGREPPPPKPAPPSWWEGPALMCVDGSPAPRVPSGGREGRAGPGSVASHPHAGAVLPGRTSGP